MEPRALDVSSRSSIGRALMLKDVLGELRAICGTGLAQLHAWASYEIAPVVAVITSRLQYAFRPTRLALPADRARNWVIHDIKIGNQSQFRSADPLSGSEFSAVNTPLDLDLVRPGQDVAVSVEYVGDNPDGEEFRGTLNRTERRFRQSRCAHGLADRVERADPCRRLRKTRAPGSRRSRASIRGAPRRPRSDRDRRCWRRRCSLPADRRIRCHAQHRFVDAAHPGRHSARTARGLTACGELGPGSHAVRRRGGHGPGGVRLHVSRAKLRGELRPRRLQPAVAQMNSTTAVRETLFPSALPGATTT